ncbi:MAG TPA: MBL fold metallo-hydrolase [Elusimicrobiales bacterium]|nr:MBL fold metallo-hydrolase [Elusimicrobiales bacterium]
MANNEKVTISFHGAAGEVTGSRHLLRSGGKSLLLDCGMFQGHRTDADAKNRTFRFPPAGLDAAILSHAHVDHCGLLPLLCRKDFDAPIYATPATAEIAGIMMADSARLQEGDAKFFNKIHAAEHLTIEPMYEEEDAKAAMAKFTPVEYGAPFAPVPGVKAKFLNAGHVLGSAMTQLELETPAGRRSLLYTGDLGRAETLLLDMPAAPQGVDYLIIESTYGDRLHEPLTDAAGKLAEVIRTAVREGGKIIVPSFALERTQEIILILDKLRHDKTVPEIPVYVDSPMAVNLTEIFNKHRNSLFFNAKFRDYAKSDGDPFSFDDIRYLRSKEESQTLNNKSGPMLIISASGMCEGGRVLHHLRNGLEKENNVILLVGYQAQGTLGRKLQDGFKKVKIFGMEHEVLARVETMHTFSSHADKNDLLAFIKAASPARGTFLVHGDAEARAALAETLGKEGIKNVKCPMMGEEFELS